MSAQQSGQHSVEIDVTDHAGSVSPEAERVVEVPFEIPTDGAIEVGSISETVQLSLPPGLFLLQCEFLQSAGTAGERVRLTLAKGDAPRFAVVRADADPSQVGADDSAACARLMLIGGRGIPTVVQLAEVQ